MMARDLARALDPVRLAADCGYTLDNWQSDLMRSTAPRVLLLCARQTGKTLITSLVALDTAIYKRPGGLVIVVSPSQRQSICSQGRAGLWFENFSFARD